MPTPFPFVSGAVLTAANLNSITELPTRTLTGSAAAVAADSYSRVILNGTSITYTINTSTFSAGQVVELYNANSTAATIAAGAGVTLNGAAGLTLAQYQTAELYAVSSTAFVLWKSDVTTTSTAGLEYITSQTIGTTVSSVTVSNVFSSTYDNYRIIVSGGVGSTGSNILIQFGAATTGYYNGFFRVLYTNSNQTIGQQNQASGVIGAMTTSYINSVCDVLSPNLAEETCYQGTFTEVATGSAAAYFGGYLNTTTAYTGFTILPGSGTLTGGTIKVYGFRN